MLNDIEMRKLDLNNRDKELLDEERKLMNRLDIIQIQRSVINDEIEQLNELEEKRNVTGK